MTDVVLNWFEVMHAAHAGIARICINGHRGAKHVYGYRLPPGEIVDWKQDIQGCIAELAVSKLINQRWTCPFGIPDVKVKDVGDHVQVRATTLKNGCLLLHDRDSPDDYYFLVILCDATDEGIPCRVPGWIRGRDGMQRKFWEEKIRGRPAYFVPQSSLKPYRRKGA